MDRLANLVELIMALYRTLPLQPPAQQYTVLASFCLTESGANGLCKIVSLATGTKCLPIERLPADGEAVHDSHAEVLARRGAVRWFLEEVGRCRSTEAFQSDWIVLCDDGRYALKDGARLVLYVSTVPCEILSHPDLCTLSITRPLQGGDASMRFLAAAQDEQMAALKDAVVHAPARSPPRPARGRDNYALWGVLRTKPGRADSPPTTSMSLQRQDRRLELPRYPGALGRALPSARCTSTASSSARSPGVLQPAVQADCTRALGGRLTGPRSSSDIQIMDPTTRCTPRRSYFTAVPFVHSRTVTLGAAGSCNDSLWWVADSPKPPEVLINGYKRGVAPRHRHRDKSRSGLHPSCSLNAEPKTSQTPGMQEIRPAALPRNPPPQRASARARHLRHTASMKNSMTEFQAAKRILTGDGGLFCGWIRGPSAQNFSAG
ncbi:hypothetical protein DFH09DRAFT_1471186 [Mycena vulgaris]|nr:hypothetical protein DFH09DRAFT_1471186 [Mycena vulgaris]